MVSARGEEVPNKSEMDASRSEDRLDNEVLKLELKKSPSIPVRKRLSATKGRQFSLNYGDGSDYQSPRSGIPDNAMLSSRSKKISTASTSSDLSPFIAFMGHNNNNRKVSSESLRYKSHSSLSLKRSLSAEGFLALPEAWQQDQLTTAPVLAPGVTAKPPLMVLLTPVADRRGSNKSRKKNAELMAAHRRRKTRRQQAKLERSGFKVFENYQNAISERRRSSDANAHSTSSSGSSSPATSEDEQEHERTGGQFLEVPLVVEPANNEEMRKRKQGTMVRRASANDMAKIADDARSDLESTRGVLSLDSTSSNQQLLSKEEAPHYNAFSRGSRLRSTWSSFGKRNAQSQDGENREISEEERRRKRDLLMQGISKLGIRKILTSKNR